MSEMVERVARVLEPQAWAALGTGDTLAYKNRRVSSLRKARAAIEEMREPTDEQRNSYYELSFRTETMSDGNWERAIDAALSTTEGGKT